MSAEDNFGIGGYDRVMGPNGQAQYWVPDLPSAREVLMEHFDRIHNIERAVEVGSVDAIISAAQMRPRIIETIEHRMKR